MEVKDAVVMVRTGVSDSPVGLLAAGDARDERQCWVVCRTGKAHSHEEDRTRTPQSLTAATKGLRGRVLPHAGPGLGVRA